METVQHMCQMVKVMLLSYKVFTLTAEYGDVFHSANTYCTFFECIEIVLEG
jgi:hypothetical protein